MAVAHSVPTAAQALRRSTSKFLAALIGATLIICSSISGSTVYADQLDDGVAAFQRGDYATALKLWRPLAEQENNPRAQHNLGSMYEEGLVVRKDYREAMKWYRRAAENGIVESRIQVAVLYYYGRGVRRDYHEAFKLLQPIAQQGNSTAQHNLGVMYQFGEGVAQDYQEAAKWYRLAAEQGHSWARNNLGLFYKEGKGVAQDYYEAVKWFRLAAEDITNGRHNLGAMYQFGEGVAQDYVRAQMWYILADKQGALSRMYNANNLTPAQIAQAQEMARQCKAQQYRNCD